MKKYIALSGLALIMACGGSSPRRERDSDSDRRTDMGQIDIGDPYDLSGIEPTDGVDSVDTNDGIPNDRQDLEDRIDAGNDSGREDMGRQDMGQPDAGVTYPIARLNCSERNEDGLCVYRTRVNRRHCWDASPSEAASGRELVNYRLYWGVPGFDIYNESETSEVCATYNVTNEEYDLPEGFPAELQVTDNVEDSASVDMRNIVTN